MESFAPIIVFAFNRPESFLNTVNSLLKNKEAKDSELFIFIDGPRPNIDSDLEKIKETKEIASNIKGFKRIKIISSKTNKGLANSIIDGVTNVIDIYGKVIVLEDDLEVAPNFLLYMNQGLVIYQDKYIIFSICGHSNKIKIPLDYKYDAYMYTRSSSWGWATWKDRWISVDWDLKEWNTCERQKNLFNRWAGSDCYRMLLKWKNGKIQSWAIRFVYAQFLQHKYSIIPNKSLICNNGFDGKGTNCTKQNPFKSEFDMSNIQNFRYPTLDAFNSKIYKSAMWYHSIILRIWNKLMKIR
jgi:hypothetical protein